MVEREEERRAKVAGRGVKADGKFQPSGISGKVTGKGHELYTRNARRLELSVGYHTRTNHFCTLFLLFLYHHHLTFALSGVTLKSNQVSFFVSS